MKRPEGILTRTNISGNCLGNLGIARSLYLPAFQFIFQRSSCAPAVLLFVTVSVLLG